MADLLDLVVIGYPDEVTAEKAYEVVVQLEHDLIMQVAGAAVVAKDADGKAKMVTKTGATRSGALMGGFFGLLFGLLFLIPVGGLILGGIMGAVVGTMTGWGIKDDFRQRVQDVPSRAPQRWSSSSRSGPRKRPWPPWLRSVVRFSRLRSPMRLPKRSTTPSRPTELFRSPHGRMAGDSRRRVGHQAWPGGDRE